jgi:hypothetical protein
VLEAPLWLYPESVMSKLGTNYIDELTSRQQTLIAMLLSLNGISLLHTNSVRWPDAYKVEDYLNDVFALVWENTSTASTMNENLRRQQQRAYVDFIGSALNPTQEKSTSMNAVLSGTASTYGSVSRSEAVLYMEQHLDRVEQYLKQQPSTPHHRNLLLRIKKIREKYESGK